MTWILSITHWSLRLVVSFKAEQEKRRREEALANATGIRVLQSIVAAVPVRLMKRDLIFIAGQVLPLLEEKRLGRRCLQSLS